MNEMQNASRQTWWEIRTKIQRTVLFNAPREIHTRVLFRRGELDVGVGLVIAEKNIEFRVVALDEIVFERQSLALVVDHNGFQVGNFTNQGTCFGVHPPRLEEIR